MGKEGQHIYTVNLPPLGKIQFNDFNNFTTIKMPIFSAGFKASDFVFNSPECKHGRFSEFAFINQIDYLSKNAILGQECIGYHMKYSLPNDQQPVKTYEFCQKPKNLNIGECQEWNQVIMEPIGNEHTSKMSLKSKGLGDLFKDLVIEFSDFSVWQNFTNLPMKMKREWKFLFNDGRDGQFGQTCVQDVIFK